MSPLIESLARQNHQTLLKAMAAISQTRVAELIGISGTTVSRMKEDDLERLAAILAACNLVAMPRSFQSIDPDKLRALKLLAREALDNDSHESTTA